MRVIKTKKMKKCNDGTVISELVLDEIITIGFIEYLRKYGEVRILSDLDPPFYSCTLEGYLTLKGMLDDNCIHVRYSPATGEAATDLFESLLADCPIGISCHHPGN